MSGQIGIDLIKGAVTGAFGIAVFAIKAFRELPQIKAEIADLQGDEIVAIVTDIVVVQIPRIVAVFKPDSTNLTAIAK